MLNTWFYESNVWAFCLLSPYPKCTAARHVYVWELLRYIETRFAPPTKVAIVVIIIIIIIVNHLTCILCHCLLELSECISVSQTTLIYAWHYIYAAVSILHRSKLYERRKSNVKEMPCFQIRPLVETLFVNDKTLSREQIQNDMFLHLFRSVNNKRKCIRDVHSDFSPFIWVLTISKREIDKEWKRKGAPMPKILFVTFDGWKTVKYST